MGIQCIKMGFYRVESFFLYRVPRQLRKKYMFPRCGRKWARSVQARPPCTERMQRKQGDQDSLTKAVESACDVCFEEKS